MKWSGALQSHLGEILAPSQGPRNVLQTVFTMTNRKAGLEDQSLVQSHIVTGSKVCAHSLENQEMTISLREAPPFSKNPLQM
jgi:hypothetical protein